MLGAVRVGAAAALLASPAVLAFFSGGFFGEPRLIAGVAAWVIVAAVAWAAPEPFPQRPPARIAIAGLAGLGVWSAVSIAWSPLKDPALADAERVALYAAALLGGVAVLRGEVRRWVEPALAGGIALVCLYALATRLLPGIAESQPSVNAGARLDQPLTYWNALGAFAGMGAVLTARVAADFTRPLWLRAGAAAAVPSCGLVVYLTFSRGALVAFAFGAIVLLLLLRRDRRALLAVAAVALTGLLAVLVASGYPAVDSLLGDREPQGAVVAAWLALVSAAGALAIVRPPAPRIAAGALVLLLVAGIGLRMAAPEPSFPEPVKAPDAREGVPLPRDRSRLRTLQTNRTKYWDVAISEGFAKSPMYGTGAHGFAALWLEHRDITEAAQDAHSLYIETAAELGLIGLLLLGGFLGGSAWAAVRRRGDPAVAGAIAAGSVFVVHAALDWDFEMPAVGLVFVALCAAILAADEDGSH